MNKFCKSKFWNFVKSDATLYPLEETANVVVVEPSSTADALVFRVRLYDAAVRRLAGLSVAVDNVDADT